MADTNDIEVSSVSSLYCKSDEWDKEQGPNLYFEAKIPTTPHRWLMDMVIHGSWKLIALVAQNPAISAELGEAILDRGDEASIKILADNPHTPHCILERIIEPKPGGFPPWPLMRTVFNNPNLNPETLVQYLPCKPVVRSQENTVERGALLNKRTPIGPLLESLQFVPRLTKIRIIKRHRSAVNGFLSKEHGLNVKATRQLPIDLIASLV